MPEAELALGLHQGGLVTSKIRRHGRRTSEIRPLSPVRPDRRARPGLPSPRGRGPWAPEGGGPDPRPLARLGATSALILLLGGCEGSLVVWGPEWHPDAGSVGGEGPADEVGGTPTPSPSPSTPEADGGSAAPDAGPLPPADDGGAEPLEDEPEGDDEEPPPPEPEEPGPGGCGVLDGPCCTTDPACASGRLCVLVGPSTGTCLAPCAPPTCRYGAATGDCVPLVGDSTSVCTTDSPARSSCDGSGPCTTEYGVSAGTLCVREASGANVCLETCAPGPSGCTAAHTCVPLEGGGGACLPSG